MGPVMDPRSPHHAVPRSSMIRGSHSGLDQTQGRRDLALFSDAVAR